MTTGMMWWCTQKELVSNIHAAVAHYEKKYGRRPELCLAHPNMLKDQKLDIEGITVRPYRPVLPGHLWIGLEEMPTDKEPA